MYTLKQLLEVQSHQSLLQTATFNREAGYNLK